MDSLFTRFLNDRSGATAIEYSLMATLIALAIIVGATLAGGNLAGYYNNIAGAFP